MVEKGMKKETLKEIFEDRRSVSSFDSNKKVEKELLRKIVNLAILTYLVLCSLGK